MRTHITVHVNCDQTESQVNEPQQGGPYLSKKTGKIHSGTLSGRYPFWSYPSLHQTLILLRGTGWLVILGTGNTKDPLFVARINGESCPESKQVQ